MGWKPDNIDYLYSTQPHVAYSHGFWSLENTFKNRNWSLIRKSFFKFTNTKDLRHFLRNIDNIFHDIFAIAKLNVNCLFLKISILLTSTVLPKGNIINFAVTLHICHTNIKDLYTIKVMTFDISHYNGNRNWACSLSDATRGGG